jgi:hypothetical protein
MRAMGNGRPQADGFAQPVCFHQPTSCNVIGDHPGDLSDRNGAY